MYPHFLDQIVKEVCAYVCYILLGMGVIFQQVFVFYMSMYSCFILPGICSISEPVFGLNPCPEFALRWRETIMWCSPSLTALLLYCYTTVLLYCCTGLLLYC